MRGVALLSGGLDSLVAAASAQVEHEVALALTVDYGQQAAAREIAAAEAQARWLGCAHEVVALPWLGALGGSALTEPGAAPPEIAVAELDSGEVAARTAAAVWVPNRNGVLANVAAAYAERRGLEAVLCGFNAEEPATFPDNGPEFLRAAEELWRFSTRGGLRLLAPLVGADKREIVRRGLELAVPLHLVWSCYRGEVGQCWRCESCRRLRRALEQNGQWESYLQQMGDRSGEWR